MAKTTAKSPATPKAKPTKAAAEVEKVESDDSAGAEKSEGGAGQMRLKELVDAVMKATGAKNKDAREIVLATLSEIGAALERGDVLNLPEFGKGKVSRKTTDDDGVSSIVLKLRRGGTPKKKDDKEALAEASE